jgi:hypothetical protein
MIYISVFSDAVYQFIAYFFRLRIYRELHKNTKIHRTLVESKNVENTGETFLALTLTHRSPPKPSFLFLTFLLSTKVGFTTK